MSDVRRGQSKSGPFSISDMKHNLATDDGAVVGLQFQVFNKDQVALLKAAIEGAGCTFSILKLRRSTSATYFVSGTDAQLREVIANIPC